MIEIVDDESDALVWLSTLNVSPTYSNRVLPSSTAKTGIMPE